MALLEAYDLQCTRGERALFSDLCFSVAAGGGLHVVGENGAGKTSLLRILCGLLAPTAGHVTWKGTAIGAQRETLGGDLVYLGHLNGVKDDLTATENLHFWAACTGRPALRTSIDAALATFGLASRAHLPTRVLSQGQKRRVALARLLLATESPLWILDEPFTALDGHGVAALRDVVELHLAGGGLMVLTTHQDVPLAGNMARLTLVAEQNA